MAWWEWVGMKTQHFPIYRSQVADHQTLLMDLTFCIVICRRLLCQVSLCMSMRHCLRWHYMCRPILKIYQLCALLSYTGHLLSDRDTASSTGMGAGVNGNNQWEWEGNGNKTRLNMGLGMGMGMKQWEWERMGLKNIFPLVSNQHHHHHHHHQQQQQQQFVVRRLLHKIITTVH